MFSPRGIWIPIAAVLAFYLFALANTGLALLIAVNSIDANPKSTGAESVSVATARIDRQMSILERRLDNFRGWLEPLDTLSKPLDWTYLGRVRIASDELLNSLEETSSATRELITAIDHLRSLRDRISNSDLSMSSLRSDEAVSNDIDAASRHSKLARSSVDSARLHLNYADDRGFSWMIGPIVSQADAQLAELENLELFTSVSVETFKVNLDLAAEIEPVIAMLRGNPENMAQIVELSERLKDIHDSAQTAQGLSGSMQENLPEFLRGSEYESLVDELYTLDSALASVTSGLSVVASVLTDTIEGLPGAGESFLEGSSAISAMAMSLVEKRGVLTQATEDLKSGLNLLTNSDFDSPLVPASIAQILTDNGAAIESISSVLIDAPQAVLELVGGPGESRLYVVLGQTSDEIRPSGGFTSSVWLLEFIGGVMQPPKYLSVIDVDDLDNLGSSGPVPEPLEVHMDTGANYLRDVGWSPHFPDVARKSIGLISSKSPLQYSGVISIDQWALRSLIDGVGEIDVAGETITAEDTFDAIEQGTDTLGTSYLLEIYKSLVASMTGDRLKNRIVPLTNSVIDVLSEKDMMIYSTDSGTQSFLESMEWTGSFYSEPFDYLYILDSNVGWNKVDRQIARQFRYTVDLRDVSNPTANLNLEYSNESIEGSDTCERQSPPEITGATYEFLKNKCYWNFVRVYVPNGSVLLDGTPLPLPSGSIAARSGALTAGSDTLQQVSDDSGDHFSGLITVEPSSDSSLDLKYEIPASTVVLDGNQFSYKLRVYAESGIKNRVGTVVVQLPENVLLNELPEGATLSADNMVTFDIQLVSDIDIELMGSIAQ
jgi:hypothetical protein